MGSCVYSYFQVPSDVARDMQRSTVEEVYALIEGDLERILDNGMLPERMADADMGRADEMLLKHCWQKCMRLIINRETPSMPVPHSYARKYLKVLP